MWFQINDDEYLNLDTGARIAQNGGDVLWYGHRAMTTGAKIGSDLTTVMQEITEKEWASYDELADMSVRLLECQKVLHDLRQETTQTNYLLKQLVDAPSG